MKHPSNWTIEDVDRQERPETGAAVAFQVILFLAILAAMLWVFGSATAWEREHGCVDYECVPAVEY